MTTYQAIEEREMRQHLEAKDFKEVIGIPKCKEMVYGKIVAPRICLRVYTSIVQGESRGCGKDAIRVAFFTKNKDGKIVMLKGAKRIHRVKTWKTNLNKRLKTMEIPKVEYCNLCGSAMVERITKQTKKKFMGCSQYPKCEGSKW